METIGMETAIEKTKYEEMMLMGPAIEIPQRKLGKSKEREKTTYELIEDRLRRHREYLEEHPEVVQQMEDDRLRYLELLSQPETRVRHRLPCYDDDGTYKPNPSVKVEEQRLKEFLRSTEMAVEHWNESHEGSDHLELVEILAGRQFFIDSALRAHFNFTAKPKVVNNGKSDDQLMRFFAEITVRRDESCTKLESKITACCQLKDDSFGACCVCHGLRRGIDHPHDGFFGSWEPLERSNWKPPEISYWKRPGRS